MSISKTFVLYFVLSLWQILIFHTYMHLKMLLAFSFPNLWSMLILKFEVDTHWRQGILCSHSFCFIKSKFSTSIPSLKLVLVVTQSPAGRVQEDQQVKEIDFLKNHKGSTFASVDQTCEGTEPPLIPFGLKGNDKEFSSLGLLNFSFYPWCFCSSSSSLWSIITRISQAWWRYSCSTRNCKKWEYCKGKCWGEKYL